MARIDIVMPAYNAGPWIDEVVESIRAQDVVDWRLIARDDASTDETDAKLREWQRRLEGKMELLEDSGKVNLRVIGSFNALLARTTAPLVMTADPDDTWKPGKIRRTLAAMEEAVARFGDGVPIAICTDGEVVDERGAAVADSYWRRARIRTDTVDDPVRQAMESVALGSTMMVNRALLDVAVPIGSGAAYQDWWLVVVAAAFGKVVVLPERTILYRRHTTNISRDPYGESLVRALGRTLRAPLAPRARLRHVVGQSARLAASFLERLGPRLTPPQRAAFEAIVRLPEAGPIARRAAIVRHGLWFGSPLKNAALLALV